MAEDRIILKSAKKSATGIRRWIKHFVRLCVILEKENNYR